MREKERESPQLYDVHSMSVRFVSEHYVVLCCAVDFSMALKRRLFSFLRQNPRRVSIARKSRAAAAA